MTVFRPQRKTRTTPTWYYRFRADGVTYERGGYPTKKKARAWEWQRRGEIGARGPQHEPPTGAGPAARLADYADTWLLGLEEHVQRGDLAPRTLRSYRELYDGHILPALGRRPIGTLTRPMLLAFLATKRDGLSKNTVRLLRSALSSLLTDALERGDLAAHPLAAGGRRRRGQRTTEAERVAHVRPMTREQRDLFLRAAWSTNGVDHGVAATTGSGLGTREGRARHHPLWSTRLDDHGARPAPSPYPLLFELLAKTGLRPGEAFALEVGDVDLDRGVLHIERAWDGHSVRPTKTHQRRMVDLTAGLVERLRQASLQFAIGSKLGGSAVWLLPNGAGHPLDLRRVRRHFRAALRAAQLPRFRLYDLRHTYATLRLMAGAPLLYVSHQLGHRDMATTARHYATWLPSMDRRWVENDDVPTVNRPRQPRATAARIPSRSGATIGRSAQRFPAR